MSDRLVELFGIACLTVLEAMALMKDVDGAMLSAVVAGIVACVSYKLAKRRSQGR